MTRLSATATCKTCSGTRSETHILPACCICLGHVLVHDGYLLPLAGVSRRAHGLNTTAHQHNTLLTETTTPVLREKTWLMCVRLQFLRELASSCHAHPRRFDIKSVSRGSIVMEVRSNLSLCPAPDMANCCVR